MLKTRIITATLLVLALIPALFFLSNTLWAILMLLLSVVAIAEWGNFIKLNVMWQRVYVAISLLLGALAIIYLQQVGFHAFFYQALFVFALVSLFWLLVVPIWLIRRFFVQSQVLMAALGLLLMASLWMALVCAKGADPWLLLVLLATICIADSAAYFAGKNFGKHKLAPTISPGKTWEGVYGALIAVTLFALMLYSMLNGKQFLIFILLWTVTLLGVMGDLFESLMKRQARLKDSGSLLPGHGGILDRIDGLIPSLPLALLMIYIYHFYQAAI